MGKVLAGMAQNLEAHQQALDASDPAARQELIAYISLISEQRHTAAGLQATAEHMTGYGDLPMGKHDMPRITTPQVLDAFTAFLNAEQELLELLQARIGRDRAMLETITAHVRSAT
jgi:hypothetical protein